MARPERIPLDQCGRLVACVRANFARDAAASSLEGRTVGGGYAFSLYCERTALLSADAVIAVSGAMRRDLLTCYPAVDPGRVHTIHNGIDARAYTPDHGDGALVRHGIDPGRPLVVFVGRIARQKGLDHLLRAAPQIDRTAQLRAHRQCPRHPGDRRRGAGAPRRGRGGGSIPGVDRGDGAAYRADPGPEPRHRLRLSLHLRPFGLVNLEAMACEAAVVASAVGGIPEIVVDGETGYLVPCDPEAVASDETAARLFEATLAERINQLVADPDLATQLGTAGRRRVLERFTWEQVALRTVEVYRQALAAHTAG